MRLPLVVLAVLLTGVPSTDTTAQKRPRRVLFVGNSLTYVNDLPSIVARISIADGAPLETHTAVAPNYGLGDHWNDGVVQGLLGRERWDVVVLQQGPSSLPESGTNLVDHAAKFGALIRSHHACPAAYMVWSEARYPRMFDAVRDHHRAAADSAHAQFLPAGDGWRAAWRRDPSFAFYSPDGLHPTPLGSYLAALVVYGGITGRSPVGDTTSVPGMVINRAQRRIVQESAAEVLRAVPRRCGVD